MDSETLAYLERCIKEPYLRYSGVRLLPFWKALIKPPSGFRFSTCHWGIQSAVDRICELNQLSSKTIVADYCSSKEINTISSYPLYDMDLLPNITQIVDGAVYIVTLRTHSNIYYNELIKWFSSRSIPVIILLDTPIVTPQMITFLNSIQYLGIIWINRTTNLSLCIANSSSPIHPALENPEDEVLLTNLYSNITQKTNNSWRFRLKNAIHGYEKKTLTHPWFDTLSTPRSIPDCVWLATETMLLPILTSIESNQIQSLHNNITGLTSQLESGTLQVPKLNSSYQYSQCLIFATQIELLQKKLQSQCSISKLNTQDGLLSIAYLISSI